MKAMILAAGLGTRLRPLTDKIPKALVEVEGITMLQRVILRLKSQGFDDIVVNVHHFPDQIVSFLDTKDFGVTINVSDESEELLDTGGGIVKAAPLLFRNDSEPVLIHNVDILSNADLKKVMKQSQDGSTLFVSDRESSRKLIFDTEGNLKGWHDLRSDNFRPEGFVPEYSFREHAFSGIYAVTKSMVEEMEILMGTDRFPVMDYFLNPGRRQPVKCLVENNLRLIDIGKPATLSQAKDFLSLIDSRPVS